MAGVVGAAAAAAAKRCMNSACSAPMGGGGEWRKGWPLRSGGFALLCDKCGLAYEQLVFCDIFHQKESGWRDCSFCGKRLHCGCIASKNSYDLLDSGGVQCVTCMKNSAAQSVSSQVVPKLFPCQNNLRIFGKSDELLPGRNFEPTSIMVDSRNDDIAIINKSNHPFMVKSIEAGQSSSTLRQKEIENGSRQIKWEQQTLSIGDMGRVPFLTRSQSALESPQCTRRDDNKDPTTDSTTSESLSEACLSISLSIANNGNKMEATSTVERPMLSPMTAIAEGRELALSPFQHAQRARHFLSRPPRVGEGAAFDPTKDIFPHLRVARPPAEGRGRNQLLPRYWPRITDQELQQISGDSNSTIVPLFEKVLSASDAGRIGRLVLPKACAEAYFPPISQPEGRPLTIQDARGKEWHFQFRFWPNNNSRMYVLEGVTPCIQSLQLQAGDTVTFSRIEPGGKLVMGFRKATNTVSLPDSQISAIANGSLLSETLFSNTNENLAVVSGYSGFLQSIKGATDLHPSSLYDHHMNSADGDVSWLKTDKFGSRPDEGSLQFLQKRSRNIGSKSRRLVMDAEDALELKLTWEEAQELLRPAPTAKPTVVMIEDYEFEEYDEPPVFAKRSIFTIRVSGEQDQWIQCDDCSKWRRLPLNVIVASKWTCADNSWDPKSCSCSAPEELTPKELQSVLQQHEEMRRRKCSYGLKPSVPEMDASSLDALATAAVFGEVGNQGTASVAATTKHPRHRPGCTCIVCIQPPSGKGPKHNPSCTCNVCMTVRRRFKTLMMRKKQRQSEREEAEASKKIAWVSRDEPEGSNLSRSPQTLDTTRESDVTMFDKVADMNKGHIDLNFHPAGRDDQEQHGVQPRPVSMMGLLEVASRPLENYMKQNGITSLAGEQGGSSSTATVAPAPVESEERTSNEGRVASVEREREPDGMAIDEASENHQDKDRAADDAAVAAT
ncbi:B3 domain-containing protein Os07g0679700-like isoform X2 [Phragmites australis]|uniref:B3 domain-containing protein Os07g0679700-like isoform X2 n=1 Tax=Phragmites australis TaxID=29695 RepID=UPI002D77D09E|nr:B3 domain-containing protein Os07g0679700-like isoform X2 [Phragmites australis]